MESPYSEPKALRFWMREYTNYDIKEYEEFKKDTEKKCQKKSPNK